MRECEVGRSTYPSLLAQTGKLKYRRIVARSVVRVRRDAKSEFAFPGEVANSIRGLLQALCRHPGNERGALLNQRGHVSTRLHEGIGPEASETWRRRDSLRTALAPVIGDFPLAVETLDVLAETSPKA
jgi:hypothetical protein